VRDVGISLMGGVMLGRAQGVAKVTSGLWPLLQEDHPIGVFELILIHQPAASDASKPATFVP
jgi:hypothetical protein